MNCVNWIGKFFEKRRVNKRLDTLAQDEVLWEYVDFVLKKAACTYCCAEVSFKEREKKKGKLTNSIKLVGSFIKEGVTFAITIREIKKIDSEAYSYQLYISTVEEHEIPIDFSLDISKERYQKVERRIWEIKENHDEFLFKKQRGFIANKLVEWGYGKIS